MTTALAVQVTDDHLMRLRRAKPLIALGEIIWNAFDADAKVVRIHLKRNTLGAVESIEIIDNGHGISYENVRTLFGNLGGSHKLNDRWSPGGRKYHGKLGHGRYKGFALGSRIQWFSTFRGSDGKPSTFEIKGSANNLRIFEVSTPQLAEHQATGVKVTIGVLEETATGLDPVKLADQLAVMMAPYLRAYPEIDLTVDGFRVNPEDLIDREVDHACTVTTEQPSNLGNKTSAQVRVKLIEWKSGTHRNKYLCDSKGIAFEVGPSGVRVGVPSYSVYVMSDLIEALWNEDLLEQCQWDPLYIAIENQVEEYLRDYFRSRLAQDAGGAVAQLKEDGVYPYQDEPATKVELVERQVFDICASKIHQFTPDFAKSPKTAKRLTLTLLREALERNPSSLQRILQQVLNLPKNEIDELDDLLQHTTLRAVINTAQLVKDRLLFIMGLRQMLFQPGISEKVLERRQLHRILVDHLWIFGEQYRYGTDDSSLKNVLKQHLKILGREELIPTANYEGLDDIPDVMLWKRYPQSEEGKFEHLVIELKRPTCHAGQEEVMQIQRYASTVAANHSFDKNATKWTFVLLVTKIRPEIMGMCQQKGRAFGHVIEGDQCDVWVREWSEVIQQAEWRLKFLEESLEVAVGDDSEGMEWLRRRYAHILNGI